MKSVKKEDITFDSDIITAALKKTPRQSIQIEMLSCKHDEDDADDNDDKEEEDSQEVIPPVKIRKAPKREAQQSSKVAN